MYLFLFDKQDKIVGSFDFFDGKFFALVDCSISKYSFKSFFDIFNFLSKNLSTLKIELIISVSVKLFENVKFNDFKVSIKIFN